MPTPHSFTLKQVLAGTDEVYGASEPFGTSSEFRITWENVWTGFIQARADGRYAQLSAIAPVATSGSYTDLIDKPAIPTGALASLDMVGTAQITNGTVTIAKLDTPANIQTYINVEDGANNYSHPNHTGDVTSTGDGATVISVGAVTTAKIADGAVIVGKMDTPANIRSYINVTDGANNYTHPNHTGDVTSTGDGVTSIAAGAVTTAKILNGAVTIDKMDTAANMRGYLNVEDGATADQSDAEIETAYNNQVSIVSQVEAEAGASTTPRRWTAQRVKQAIDALSGGSTTIADGSVTTVKIADNAVNLAKMSDMATASFIGRLTAGTGDPEILSAAQARTLLNVEDGATADQTGPEIVSLIDTQLGGATWQTGGGSITDGDKGDITVSGGGATWTLDDNTVTTAKIVAGAVTVATMDTPANIRTHINVEDGATADQTGTEIVSAIDTELGQTTWKTGSGGVTDGDKGDITVSGGGTVWSVDDGAIVTSKVADAAITAAKLAPDAQVDFVAQPEITSITPGIVIPVVNTTPNPDVVGHITQTALVALIDARIAANGGGSTSGVRNAQLTFPTGVPTGGAFMINEAIIGASHEFWTEAQSGADAGGDIQLYTDEAGTNRLPVHVKSIDITNKKVDIRFRVASAIPANGNLWLRYGNTGTALAQPSAGAQYGSREAYPDMLFMGYDPVTDETGNFTGTLTGTAIQAGQGQFGEDVRGFGPTLGGGASDEIRLAGASGAFDLTSGKVAMRLRVNKIVEDPNVTRDIIGALPFSVKGWTDGQVRFALDTGSTRFNPNTTSRIVEGAWTSVVVVYDGVTNVNEATYYIDDDPAFTATTTGGVLPTVQRDDFYVGVADGSRWSGMIADLGFWVGANVDAIDAAFVAAMRLNETNPTGFATLGAGQAA